MREVLSLISIPSKIMTYEIFPLLINKYCILGALLTAEHVKDHVKISVEEGQENILRVSE